MSRFKTFDATGIAPGGRLFAGDLNGIQDLKADQANFSQTVDVGTLRVGGSDVSLTKFGANEGQFSGALRTLGKLMSAGGIDLRLTTTARDALAAGQRPTGLIIFNSTTGTPQVNIGSDATPAWVNLAPADSPTFTGTAAAPTPAPGDNSTKIATTAFIQAILAGGVVLGGNPTAPTAAPGDTDLSLANTAFVDARAAVVETLVNTGKAWVTSFTPNLVLSGGGTFSIGNATRQAQYMQIGKSVRYQGQIAFGTTTSWTAGGTLHLTLPINADAASLARELHGVSFDEMGGSNTAYNGTAAMFGTTEMILSALKPQTSTRVQITPTQPFTWATNSIVSWDFVYRCV